MKLFKPAELGELGLKESFSNQPDTNQANRGTLFSQRWVGERAGAVGASMSIRLHLQRELDQAGARIDDAIPFGIAVTVSMPGVTEIYEEVRQRLAIRPSVR
ncbi:MAG: hypothetical protein IPH76_07420 [Xanthomonadales bacterium]|nr:hypothetical protein [Xanthomonadales bacterium]